MANFIAQWAGWNRSGYRADAIWAAAYADDGIFEYRYGSRTYSHRTGKKQFSSADEARRHLEKMVREKTEEGYSPIGFDDQMTNIPSWGGRTLSVGEGADTVGAGSTRALRQIVESISWTELQDRQWSGEFGAAELVDGTAVTISGDGVGGLAAYGPSGREVKLPARAAALARLGRATVKGFVAPRGKELILTDIRESGNRLYLDDGYRARRDALADALKAAGLASGVAPTLSEARALANGDGVIGLGAEADGDRFGEVINHVFVEHGRGVVTRWMGTVQPDAEHGAVAQFEFYANTLCVIRGLDRDGAPQLALLGPQTEVIDVGVTTAGLSEAQLAELAVTYALIASEAPTDSYVTATVRHLQLASGGDPEFIEPVIVALGEGSPWDCRLGQLPKHRVLAIAEDAGLEI